MSAEETEESISSAVSSVLTSGDTTINDSIGSALLSAGLIRRVVSPRGIGYEVTDVARHLIDDYEHLEHHLDEIFPSKTSLFTTYVGFQYLRNLLRHEKSETHATERVSIVIPTLNEAMSLAHLLKHIPKCLPEMPEIIVVDASTDETAFVATGWGAKVLTQRGTGKGNAVRQAFSSNYEGEIIVMMDADGSNRPEELPQLIASIVNGADIAKGSRFLKGGGSKDLSRIRKIGNKLFVSLVNLRWSGGYTDLCYGYLAFRKEALEKLAPLLDSKHFQIETEICIKALKLHLNVVEVPSLELERSYGTSNLSGFHDSIRILRTIISELF